MLRSLKRLWKNEDAASATEYGVVVAIVALGLIITLIAFRDKLAAMFTRAGNAVDGVGPEGGGGGGS
ncbi:MAG: Flp family type IVb pilin [Deltaproteobacteria bacterium]|nr:Flp family type IVb pilin [Deltaproteobacteria bacterium]